MSGLAFFDTNVLIYADDASTPRKQERAISLIAEHQRQNSSVLGGFLSKSAGEPMRQATGGPGLAVETLGVMQRIPKKRSKDGGWFLRLVFAQPGKPGCGRTRRR